MSPTTATIEDKPGLTTEQPTSEPFTLYCLNCGGEIMQQPAHLAKSGAMATNCPYCETKKGRTAMSPAEFAADARLRGSGYLEKAGISYLVFKQ